MDNKPKIGIFVGSFNPYTIGHDSVVHHILPLFDRLVISMGINMQKRYRCNGEERIKAIGDLYADEPHISMKSYHDLAVDFAKREGVKYLIKGIRSVKDFEYEREQADINRQISGIDTILLFADPGMANVSPPLVRELLRHDADASVFLPQRETDHTK